MANVIDGLLDAITSSPAFAMTRSEAHEKGCCVKCGQPFSPENVRDAAEQRETQLSGICGLCWDKLFEEFPTA